MTQPQRSQKPIQFKLPESDRSLEAMMLACVLKEQRTYSLEPRFWQEPDFRRIMDAAVWLADQQEPLTLSAIYAEIRRVHPEWDHQHAMNVLLDVLEETLPFTDNIPPETVEDIRQRFLQYVKRHITARELAQQAADASDPAHDPDLALQSVRGLIDDLLSMSLASRTTRSIADLGVDYLASLERQEQETLTSGFRCVDKHCAGGWAKGDLIIIAARPSVGKTAMMLSSVYQTRKCHHHLVLSYEMTARALHTRLLSMATSIPYADLTNRQVAEWNRQRIEAGLQEITDSRIDISDVKPKTLADIEALIDKVRPGILWVDYLQRMRGLISRRSISREEEVATYSSFFKQLALDYDMPVIVLAQLNRSAVKEGRSPRLFDLRESGAIEQDADVVLGLDDIVEDRRIIGKKVLVLKARNFARSVFTMGWHGNRAAFVEP